MAKRSVLVLALVACGVGSIDLAGRQCPCVDEWICDTATGTCVLDTNTTAPTAVPTGTDPPPPPPPPPGGTIMVSDLRADWVTPNTIRWSFAVNGNPAEFLRYELVTGPSKAIVESHVGAKAWTTLNQELSEFAPRTAAPPAGEFRVWTITQEHVPGTVGWAQVTAVDKNGRGQSVAAAAKTSAEATDAFVIFNDPALPGSPEPNATQFARVTSGAFGTSSHCYSFTVKCAAGAATCDDTFGQRELAKTITAMNQAEFDRAFVEFQLRATSIVPREYMTFHMQIGADTCSVQDCRYRMFGLGISTKDIYRVFQLPLRRLVRTNDPRELDLDVLRQRNFRLHAVFWASTWNEGAQVRVDEIKIRW